MQDDSAPSFVKTKNITTMMMRRIALGTADQSPLPSRQAL
jgi:hypothetical protein